MSPPEFRYGEHSFRFPRVSGDEPLVITRIVRAWRSSLCARGQSGGHATSTDLTHGFPRARGASLMPGPDALWVSGFSSITRIVGKKQAGRSCAWMREASRSLRNNLGVTRQACAGREIGASLADATLRALTKAQTTRESKGATSSASPRPAA